MILTLSQKTARMIPAFTRTKFHRFRSRFSTSASETLWFAALKVYAAAVLELRHTETLILGSRKKVQLDVLGLEKSYLRLPTINITLLCPPKGRESSLDSKSLNFLLGLSFNSSHSSNPLFPLMSIIFPSLLI